MVRKHRVTTRGVCPNCGTDGWTRSGNRWRCRECNRRTTQKHLRKRRKEDYPWSLWQGAKQRAKRSGIPFTITADDVRALWPKDNRCPVFGKRFVHGRGRPDGMSASIDRLNNAWGYEPGNIAIISYKANRAKGNMSATDLRKVADWMTAHGLD